MQITLTQSEIEVGIKMYIQSRGVRVADRNITTDFTATRKGNSGISVEVDLGEDSVYDPSHAVVPAGINVVSNRSGGYSARRTPVEPVEDSTTPEVKPQLKAVATVNQETVTEAPAVEETPEVPVEAKKEEPAPETEAVEEAPVEEKAEDPKAEPAKQEAAPANSKPNPFASADMQSEAEGETTEKRRSLFS